MRFGQNTEHKTQLSTDKKVEFQHDETFQASKFHFMGWKYYKLNNTALSLKCK